MNSARRNMWFKYYLPSYLYAGLIFTLSSYSLVAPPSLPTFSDKWIHFAEYTIFGLLLATCLVIALIILIPETPGGKAFDHPDHSAMLQSPDGMERHRRIMWLGGIFGILQFCFATSLIALCLNKQGRLKIFKTPLIICMLLCITVFVSMMAAYMVYARDGSGPLIGSFPLPTALMLYALWPIPILFVIVYIMYYDKAIFTAEDEKKFQALVRSHRESTKDAD